jgi:hypothetical protein
MFSKASEICPYRWEIGIRLRKAHYHLVSEASMLFDDTLMVKNVVSVNDIFPHSLIVNLPLLYLFSLQAL